jgi:two-component system cell cycle sensor histidine kinase PleC
MPAKPHSRRRALPSNQSVKPAAGTDALAFSSAALRPEDLRRFLEMTGDLMCSMHPDGGMIRFNPAFLALLGYEPQAMIGKVFVDFVDPADRAGVRAALYGLCQFETQPPPVDIECRLLTRSGDSRQTSWKVQFADGAFYALGKDVTESKTREAAILRRDQQLLEAQALAHMGHWRWEVGATEIEWSDELYNIFGVRLGEFNPVMY